MLGAKLRDEVHYLQKNIIFIVPENIDNDKLRKLRQAILERKTARFVYHTRYPDAESQAPAPRDVDPYGLLHDNEAWYLLAYCHTRHGIRNFRLDRMDSVELLARTFARTAPLNQYDPDPEARGRRLAIRALFDPAIARWVRESRYFYVVSQEDTPDGLLVTLRVRQESEALQWLLSWGGNVKVLEPESLRRQIAGEAEKLLANHQK